MTTPRQIHLEVSDDGTIRTGSGVPITFRSPQELWNFCTGDVSRDRQFYARPRLRSEKAEAEARNRWLENNRPATADEIRALVLQKIRSSFE